DRERGGEGKGGQLRGARPGQKKKEEERARAPARRRRRERQRNSGRLCAARVAALSIHRNAIAALQLGSGSARVFSQAEDGIRDSSVTGVQTCALPILQTGMFASSMKSIIACPIETFSVS